MSEKYRIEHDSDSTGMYLVISDKSMLAMFNEEPDAKEYCDFKNAEGMDKEVKSVALNCLKAVRLYGIRPTDFNIEYLDKAIEIISKIKEKE